MPTLRLLPELEQSLRQINGVRAASVVTGPDKVPTEVHVLAGRAKPAKQVVRDVQSLAMASFDLDLDHRIVSVVQIDDGDPALSAAADGHADPHRAPDRDRDRVPSHPVRPVIVAVGQTTSADRTEVSLTLRVKEDVLEGRASGPAGPASRARIVAEATLAAVEDVFAQPCGVESAYVSTVGTRAVAVCVLTTMVPSVGEQALVGAALVRGDEAEAVARCVLSALDRQLTG
jgi:hypothetical protein